MKSVSWPWLTIVDSYVVPNNFKISVLVKQSESKLLKTEFECVQLQG